MEVLLCLELMFISFNLYMSDVKWVTKTALIIVGLRGAFCRPQKFTDKNGILRNEKLHKS